MNLKKLTALLLALVLVLSLAACAETKTEKPDNDEPEITTTENTPVISDEQPNVDVDDSCGYIETTVSVPSSVNSYEIPAVLTLPEGEGPFPLVVMNHGFAGSKDENIGFIYLARCLAKAGIASIRMDFCGSGDSTVDFLYFSETSAVNDSNDCLHYALENANIDADRLGLFGYSNGGVISAIIAAEADCPYSARVLLAPAVTLYSEDTAQMLAYAEENGCVEIPFFGRTLQIGADYYRSSIEFHENLETYLQPSIDTLIIYGTEDTSVPPANNEEYAAAINADVLRIYGATHSYGFYDGTEEGYRTMDTVAGAMVQYFASRLTEDNAAAMFGE